LIKLACFILLVFLLSGCTYSNVPKNNSDFENITNIKQLEGTYKNKGDPNTLLSWSLFKKLNKNIPHESIEFIQVTIKNKTFQVNAINNNCIAHEEMFIYGRDFEIKNDVIVIYNDFSFLNSGEGLGPSFARTVIGIDKKGHGKIKHTTGGFVLYGLFLPIVGTESSEYRFTRTKLNKTYRHC